MRTTSVPIRNGGDFAGRLQQPFGHSSHDAVHLNRNRIRIDDRVGAGDGIDRRPRIAAPGAFVALTVSGEPGHY
jgi:hypothetical protein